MISTTVTARTSMASTRGAAHILKTISNNGLSKGFRPGSSAILLVASPRHFSTSPNNPKIQEFFVQKETDKVRKTPPAWPHPIYTYDQMQSVVVAHREAKTMSDKVALQAVKVLRWGLDFATGYKHEKAMSLNAKDPEAARKKYGMTEERYMIRNVFLESVAGVPGMVAGMIRHLHSMRRMKRDNGW